LAPTLQMTTERDEGHPPLLAQLLSLLNWLGVAKPVFLGRDFGAVLCCVFKKANPGRAGTLVLENQHQQLDAAEYKKRMKADPNYIMTAWQDCWTWIGDLMAKDKAKAGDNVKGMKGNKVLLWPCHFKGAPDPKLGKQQMAQVVAKALKTQIVDSYGFTDAEVAEHVLKAMPSEAS